jgi:hypothetical protein
VGRTLIVAGLILAAVGAIVLLVERTSLPIGRLPGDIVWRGRNTTVYFPIVTSLLASALLTLLFRFFQRR